MSELNALGQPVGAAVDDWQTRPRPPKTAMHGRYCRVEPIDPGRHAADLFAANTLDTQGANWTYMPYGPFDDLASYRAWMDQSCRSPDPYFHAVIDLQSNQAVGVASLMRINPEHGVIEVGHINYSPLLQRRIAGTEAMFLLMRRAFDELGYRRYEWKCNALNEASKGAALRLGFTFEGVFRQANVFKGRNRDTAWFSLLDSEWPATKAAFEQWLAPANFAEDGQQIQSLRRLMQQRRLPS